MRLALLGCDADALAVALAAAHSAEDQVVWAHDVGEHAGRIAAAEARLSEHWEGLLDSSVADAVIVARGGDEEVRADQLRRLVQAGVHLLVSHPVHSSMLVYYELDMIRQESQSLLMPFPSLRWHAAMGQLAELVAQGEASALGRLEQLVIERTVSDRRRQSVLKEFVRDLDAAVILCGELTSVAAMAPGGGVGAGDGNLGVQMSGPAGILVRFSALPPPGPAARYALIGSRGRAVLEIPKTDGAWRLESPGQGGPAVQVWPDWKWPNETLSRLRAALAKSPLRPDWIDASRTMELADAVDHSLQRGRMVQVHFEGPSEHSTFKGLMSGLGCLLLLGTLVLTVAAAVAGSVFKVPVGRIWPAVLLAILGTFLLLQLFKLAFPDPPERRPP